MKDGKLFLVMSYFVLLMNGKCFKIELIVDSELLFLKFSWKWCYIVLCFIMNIRIVYFIIIL